MAADWAWLDERPAQLAGEPRSDRRPVAPRGFFYRIVTTILKPLLHVFTKPTWQGIGNVPATGGVILAANHVSQADPVTLGDFVLYGTGRIPRYLAKASLFRVFFVGWVLRGARQIPVHREQAEGGGALDAAVAALRRGDCVVIYPEGTVTADPQGWPMAARTGAARLALESGAPVVPVGQWGVQRLLGSTPGKLHPHAHLRAPVTVVAGEPVDLSAYAGRPLTADLLRTATADILAAVAACTAEARGAALPDAPPFDPRGQRDG